MLSRRSDPAIRAPQCSVGGAGVLAPLVRAGSGHDQGRRVAYRVRRLQRRARRLHGMEGARTLRSASAGRARVSRSLVPPRLSRRHLHDALRTRTCGRGHALTGSTIWSPRSPIASRRRMCSWTIARSASAAISTRRCVTSTRSPRTGKQRRMRQRDDAAADPSRQTDAIGRYLAGTGGGGPAQRSRPRRGARGWPSVCRDVPLAAVSVEPARAHARNRRRRSRAVIDCGRTVPALIEFDSAMDRPGVHTNSTPTRVAALQCGPQSGAPPGRRADARRAAARGGRAARSRGPRSSGHVAIVSHGDVIRAALMYFLGMPLDLLHRIEISPARISMVTLGRAAASRAASERR